MDEELRETEKVDCATCGGDGKVRDVRWEEWDTCKTCEGTGKVWMTPKDRQNLYEAAILIAMGRVRHEGRLRAHLYAVRKLCTGPLADDPGYLKASQDLDQIFMDLPNEGDRLMRALGIEPEVFDYYSSNDWDRDRERERREQGLGPTSEEEPFPDIDIYALIERLRRAER
jgi:hypothetical protein